MTQVELTRRTFLAGAVAGLARAALPASPQDARPPWKIGGFTKVLQDLSFENTAKAAKEVGWDGIECPVRAKGQVLPDRADEDLPKLAEALKAKGLELLVLATDIRSVDDPGTEKVLRAASRLGVRLYRLGPLRYKEGTSIPRQLEEFQAKLKDLSALNRDLGVMGLLQNHSGNGYVGAAIWDLFELIRDLNPAHMGVHFDIGHATVENGLSWPTSFSLVKDRIGAVIVKDFFWKGTSGEGGKPQWVPLGKGIVQPRFFQMLRATPFRGPVTMQFEYPFEGGDALDSRLRSLRGDNETLRGWLNP